MGVRPPRLDKGDKPLFPALPVANLKHPAMFGHCFLRHPCLGLIMGLGVEKADGESTEYPLYRCDRCRVHHGSAVATPGLGRGAGGRRSSPETTQPSSPPSTTPATATRSSIASGVPGTRHIDLRGKAIVLGPLDGEVILDAAGAGSVIRCTSGEGTDTIIEGLVIRGGLAERGAGLLTRNSTPTIRDCVFEANESLADGAAWAGDRGGPTFVGCLFLGNTAGEGETLSCGIDCTPLVLDCRFTGNCPQPKVDDWPVANASNLVEELSETCDAGDGTVRRLDALRNGVRGERASRTRRVRTRGRRRHHRQRHLVPLHPRGDGTAAPEHLRPQRLRHGPGGLPRRLRTTGTAGVQRRRAGVPGRSVGTADCRYAWATPC